MIHTCPSCKRILQKSQFDKCMLCGSEIPIHLRLSDTEKEDVREEFKANNQYKDNSERERMSYSTTTGLFSTGCDIGSDFP